MNAHNLARELSKALRCDRPGCACPRASAIVTRGRLHPAARAQQGARHHVGTSSIVDGLT